MGRAQALVLSVALLVAAPGAALGNGVLDRIPWGADEPEVRQTLPIEACVYATVRRDSERVCVAPLSLGDIGVRAYLRLRADRLVRVDLLFPSRFHEAVVAQFDDTFGPRSATRFPRVVVPPLTFTNEVSEWSTDTVRAMLSKYHSGYGKDSQATLELIALPD